MIYSCGSADGDTNFLPRTVQHTGALKVLLLTISVNCQLLRDEERPTRYVLPYSGLGGSEDQEVTKEDHYYKPNRRAERIPATAYQYDEAEEEYYRPQPRHKVESDNYRYQPNTPSHKDYEEILKHNHLVRLRVAAKKTQPPQPPPTAPPQPQAQPQPVEQYLKEVNPTTKTAYQRPANYLRYSGQSPVLKQEQNEETPALKQQPYRYVLQSDLQQQKSYPQYQYESQEAAKAPQPKAPHFNLVAYQNALIAQQKLLAAASGRQREEEPPKYAPPTTIKKTKKQKGASSRQSSTQYDYYPQRPTYTPEAASARYQQPLTQRNLYQKSEPSFQVEDTLLYPEQKETEYQTQPPVRAPKQRTTRPPRRKPKFQTEELLEEYPRPAPKYQQEEEETFEYPPSALKYNEEQQAYRRPLPRPTKLSKYEEQTEAKEDDYLYQPLPKYTRENIPRRPPPAYPRDSEVRPRNPEVRPSSRYLSRQYQDESRQLPQYEAASDLIYQPTAEAPVRQGGRGPSVSYRQELQNSSVRFYRNLGNPESYVE